MASTTGMSDGAVRTAPAHEASAVRELLTRHLGARADEVVLEPLPRLDGVDRYEHEIAGGRLILRGTDAITLAVAARDAAAELGSGSSWDSPRWLDLPARLDDRPPIARATRLRTRYYLNFVTYGYTAAYWDWDRWEREIDWMALHGITMPLMAIAHEAVLTETLRELGLSDARIAEWIGGAAHFPWTWMGGTNEWGGPLPADWTTRHLQLARRVLERQRALGMTPVLPGFAGHVPPELAADAARTIEWQGWTTPVLDAREPEFARIAEVFYRHQHELLGTDHHYAVDPYIESVPPSGEVADLAETSAGIFGAMRVADPNAVWVLQGWPFHYHSGFWTEERVRAFLDPVPNDAMLLLDLWAEHAPMWRRSEALWGRRWLWCAVHNFGGRPALFGDVAGLRRDLTEVQSDAARGELVGFGLTMEAIENNAVFYELATDLVWQPTPGADDWLARFVRARYGVDAPAALEAWQILTATLYAPGRTRSIPSPVIARPWSASAPFAGQRLAGEFIDTAAPERQSANIDAENDPAVLGDLATIADAVELLATVAGLDGVDRRPLERDLVELAGHVVAQHTRLAIRGILAGASSSDASAIERSAEALDAALLELDALAATHEESLVGRWLADARAWGSTAEEAAALELDARRLISVWGRQTSGLHDYSGRHWSGLIRDLYRPRWRAWSSWLAAAARDAAPPDVDVLRAAIVRIEETWATGREPYPSTTSGDPVAAAVAAILARRADLERLRSTPPGDPGVQEHHTEIRS
ncbi:alpha-N-acetylglucosaminidase [Agromyces silvae]|uniref:alpha-N-acetylglucosaminidase n=1 Tax=Agromyces silvae TaxID=3388266 RepID=UPI00280B6F0E|nr:alpha-N-acetylglucosaminidase TIM-barrel domain-containing protein [Agromyces protaetiae]